MVGTGTKLQVSMPAEPMSVRALRSEVLRWLREQGERSERVFAAVALATSEAASNVVRHAYPGARGRIDLDARLAGDEVVIEIRDSGEGISSGARKPSLHGGMGLPLIDQVADGIVLYSDEDGTCLTMRFALAARPQSAWPGFLRDGTRVRVH